MIVMPCIPEYAAATDRFYDYCLYPYVPKTTFAGKMRSVNLLWHSFKSLDCPAPFYDLVMAIRNGVGANRTVWGFKNFNRVFSWEYYFYNYSRNSTITLTNLLGIMAPLIQCGFTARETLPYFMFSVDINPENLAQQRLPGIHLYMGNEGRRSRGISYFLTEHGLRLENHYSFFDPHQEMANLKKKLWQSVWVDLTVVAMREVLLPELVDCKTICVANKQECDAIYFSGLNFGQLWFFLQQFDYPPAPTAFISNHQSQLDHLQFDVGFDFRMEGGRLEIIKSGYYGTF